MDQGLVSVLLLLGLAVACTVAFQRLHVPTSLAYLAVGVLLGPHTAGPVVDGTQVRALAEFGIVFLLFTIGLNFALPQLMALRHQVLGLGTAQVALTTLVVALLAWLAGLPPAAAFVVGAVFAQSSTTIISKQLAEQGEENTRHGRLGTAMSVFQDVTAVPFVVVIPVLGSAAGVLALGSALGVALGKAVVALLLVFFLGRWALRPLFHLVTARRSAELLTLTVLFVSLGAAAVTASFGLSLAFGAFLAGMVLGETEFRHQVESAIRPFRDVLLGLFFIGIGMLFDPAVLPAIWDVALLGAAVLLAVKLALVAGIVRFAGIDAQTAWRTGLIVAVGGEFGFALLAIALSAGALDDYTGQVVLTSVLLSMAIAPFLIRYNLPLSRWLATAAPDPSAASAPTATGSVAAHLQGHVVICGYGRIGQSVGHLLEVEEIPYIALDLDGSRVRDAHLAGEPVYYGDASDPAILESVGILRARLVVVSNEDVGTASRILHHVRVLRPDVPVMVRTRDDSHVERLRAEGATAVVPETFEAGLMIASHALLMLDVPLSRVVGRMTDQREAAYPLLRGYFRGDILSADHAGPETDRLHSVVVPEGASIIGRTLADCALGSCRVQAVVREGQRELGECVDVRLGAGDTVVLLGSEAEIEAARRALQD